MSRPTANLRLFVAAYPPPDAARAMLLALDAMDLPPHRATPAEQVHLTIHFIGDRPVRDMDHVVESFRRAAGGLEPFTLTPDALIALPSRGRPRLIALRTDAPAALLELQRRLAIRFARKSRRDAADRFLPHFTLCRFPEGGATAPNAVRTPAVTPLNTLGEPGGAAGAPFEVRRVFLMRSTLSPGGATHHRVEEAALGA